MKKYIFLLSVFFSTQSAIAQVKEIITDIYGQFEIVVQVGDDAYVTISSYGEILDIDMEGYGEYYSDFYDYEAGKIKKIKNTYFTYYSNFNDYEAGKIKKIGGIEFSYYSKFNDYEAGKIQYISSTLFGYYSAFNDYEAGKVKKIGNTIFNYYSAFNDYEVGKIKSIGENRFSYYSNWNSKSQIGKLKSGAYVLKNDEILFHIKQPSKHRHEHSR